jgi:hypothetical protein
MSYFTQSFCISPNLFSIKFIIGNVLHERTNVRIDFRFLALT